MSSSRLLQHQPAAPIPIPGAIQSPDKLANLLISPRIARHHQHQHQPTSSPHHHRTQTNQSVDSTASTSGSSSGSSSTHGSICLVNEEHGNHATSTPASSNTNSPSEAGLIAAVGSDTTHTSRPVLNALLSTPRRRSSKTQHHQQQQHQQPHRTRSITSPSTSPHVTSPYAVTRKPSLIKQPSTSATTTGSPNAAIRRTNSNDSASTTMTNASSSATSTTTTTSNSNKKPSAGILNALITTTKKGSFGAAAARSSLERPNSQANSSSNGTSYSARNNHPTPHAYQRKASFSRAETSRHHPPNNPKRSSGGSHHHHSHQEVKEAVTSPRERIGRNGQPLQRYGTRTKNAFTTEPSQTAVQQYILHTKGQLGLEFERQTSSVRFDPLADDESEHEPAALVIPLSPPSGSIQHRERQGSKIIAGAIAAQKAGKRWTMHQDQEGGVVHIAAGVVLPPLAAASLASGALLQQSRHTTPNKQARTKTPGRNSGGHATASPPSSTITPATTSTQSSQPLTINPNLPHPTSPPTPSSTDLIGLSAKRRSSWEKEHPNEPPTRAERIAAQEQQQLQQQQSLEEKTSLEVQTEPAGVATPSSISVVPVSVPSPSASSPSDSSSSSVSASPPAATGTDSSVTYGLNPRRRRSLEEEEAAATTSSPKTTTTATLKSTALTSHSSTPAANLNSSSPKLQPRRKFSGTTNNTASSHTTSSPTTTGPAGNVADPRDANRGRIERRPSFLTSNISPSGSPIVSAVSPTVGTPTINALPPPAISAANNNDTFQQSNSAAMTSDAVQERWRRNLMKRMSVNISFAPSPFSGLLGGAINDRSPNSGSGGQVAAIKGGSFSTPTTNTISGANNELSPGLPARELGLNSRNNSSSSAASANAPGVSGRRSITKMASLERRGSIRERDANLTEKSVPHRRSTTIATLSHVTHPLPLAAQQTNSHPEEGASIYPQNPNFSFLFPHQELLAQQREYYDVCNKKLFDYLNWTTDQHMDPVVVPAWLHSHYHSFRHHTNRHSHGSSTGSEPKVASALTTPTNAASISSSPWTCPMPPSLPSHFDINFWNCYSSIQNWEVFDIFNFSEYTQGWPLSFMFVIVLKKSDLFTRLKLDVKVAFRFIQEVESHYLPNPYHTSIHAADVLHAVYHFVNDSILREQLSDVDKFLLYFSCAIHDFAHPGVNNSFLVASRAPLAIRYNDRHVLEAFHASSAFRMMQLTSGCNILEAWDYENDPKVYARCRKMIIDMVLATDLAMHFDLVRVMKGKFETMMNQALSNIPSSSPTPTNESGANSAVSSFPATPTAAAGGAAHNHHHAQPAPIPSAPTPASPTSVSSGTSSTSSAPPLTSTGSGSSLLSNPPAHHPNHHHGCGHGHHHHGNTPSIVPNLNLTSDEDITLVLQCLLKLGDLSHPSRPKNLHLRWAELVTEEFFSQGDRERSLNLTPSMFMDRHTTNVATSQLGFLTFLVLPLFQVAGKLQQNGYWVRKVEKNLELWVELEKIEKREQEQKDAEERATANGELNNSLSLNTNSISEVDTNSLTSAGTFSLRSQPPPTPSTAALNDAHEHSLIGVGSLNELILAQQQQQLQSTSKKSTTPPMPTIPQASDTPAASPTNVDGVDLSIYPPHHVHHHHSGSSSSSGMSSGSGSIAGRFSSVCKDRTVLSMFQKVREIGSNQVDDSNEPSPHEHAHFLSAVETEENMIQTQPAGSPQPIATQP